jgi:hypothetical protein
MYLLRISKASRLFRVFQPDATSPLVTKPIQPDTLPTTQPAPKTYDAAASSFDYRIEVYSPFPYFAETYRQANPSSTPFYLPSSSLLRMKLHLGMYNTLYLVEFVFKVSKSP